MFKLSLTGTHICKPNMRCAFMVDSNIKKKKNWSKNKNIKCACSVKLPKSDDGSST